MVELHPAYVAGFLDGEGTVRINKCKRKESSIPRFETQVCIVNTCPEPLFAIRDMFGGGVYTRKHLPRHKTTYHWTLAQKASVAFLKVVLPYLIIKRERAELALEFYEKKTICKPGRKIPLEELALRKSYYERMKELNK